jgi:hypothetical protein
VDLVGTLGGTSSCEGLLAVSGMAILLFGLLRPPSPSRL